MNNERIKTENKMNNFTNKAAKLLIKMGSDIHSAYLGADVVRCGHKIDKDTNTGKIKVYPSDRRIAR